MSENQLSPSDKIPGPKELREVLDRLQRDYDRHRPGLVGDTLGLIWASRRGLTQTELLRLLKPADKPELPLASWFPLRDALHKEGWLVERDVFLNFADECLRAVVENAFVPDEDRRDDLRLQLADDFESQPISPRSCDELPWLLFQTESYQRLRRCLLSIDRFLEIKKRDGQELWKYWFDLGEERTMGPLYLDAFEQWSRAASSGQNRDESRISQAASEVGLFLRNSSLFLEAEVALRRALEIDEENLGSDHPLIAIRLTNLASVLESTSRLDQAEELHRRALSIDEKCLGPNHGSVAIRLTMLAGLLQRTNRLAEAEPLIRRSIAIVESSFGPEHPNLAMGLSNLAVVLHQTNRMDEAERLVRRVLAIDEKNYGPDHTSVARDLNNLAGLLELADRLAEAEALYRRAEMIFQNKLGMDHPFVGTTLNNLAQVLKKMNRMEEAEPIQLRALQIFLRFARATRQADPRLQMTMTNYGNLLAAKGHSIEEIHASLHEIAPDLYEPANQGAS